MGQLKVEEEDKIVRLHKKLDGMLTLSNDRVISQIIMKTGSMHYK